jgi:protein SCO1/2
LAGCAKKPKAAEKRYTLTGDIVGLNGDSQIAVVKGDKIEGWMDAMTMDYPVKDKSEFRKLAVGERIQATVFVSDAGYAIGEIKSLGKAEKK